uniref:Rho guanine nucleotide exchange factor 2 n=1 Tax=Romanomermis culicivorax TaxID=13658 RepID=A0A915IC48_ROMCU
LNDLNHNNNSFKPKDKERRSFFKHKSKSKELRQHHSWSNPNFKASICDLCAKKLFNNQELLHCSDCGINIHSSCKDQAEKFGCPKSGRSSLKNSQDETDQKNGKIAPNEEPVHVLARRKTIDEENCDKSDNDNVIIRTSSLSFNNSNANNRGSMTSLIKNHPLSVVYPNGFYAATSPDALWEELNLWAEEPEAWSSGIGKLEKKRLTSKEIKRQDIMHELYITEKHHCQILVVLKHTYSDTLINQNIIPGEEVDKLLPKLDHLLNLHQNFLRNLKKRKDECVIVETIHDVIHEQFSNDNAKLLIEAYTQFCAQKDLTDGMFQKFLQNNLNYQNFIKVCEFN